MPVQHEPTAGVERQEQSSDTRGWRLLLPRGTWIAVATLTLAIFFASLPVYRAQLRTPCTGTTCHYQQLTPGQVEALKGVGLSLDGYAALLITLLFLSAVVSWAVSALIMWRRSDDWMAVLVALLLVTLGMIEAPANVPTGPSPWQEPHTYLTFLVVALLVLVFLLFPSGRFAPRWMRWVCVALLIGLVPVYFVPDAPLLPYTPVSQVGWLAALVEMAIGSVAQLYRYRRVSTPAERQQTKWVMFGLAVPITFDVVLTVLALGFPAQTESNAVYVLAVNSLDFLLPLLLPLSFGFAVLRTRLWDIDALANRTLVYATLTLILTGVFVGLVIGLQALLGGIIRQNNSVAIVVSTLAVAALVRPVYRRLQAHIDERFYRKKYDAQKTLAAFSAALPHEVNLEQVQTHLLAVVRETMEPSQVSLWLRPPDQPHGERW